MYKHDSDYMVMANDKTVIIKDRATKYSKMIVKDKIVSVFNSAAQCAAYFAEVALEERKEQ